MKNMISEIESDVSYIFIFSKGHSDINNDAW